MFLRDVVVQGLFVAKWDSTVGTQTPVGLPFMCCLYMLIQSIFCCVGFETMFIRAIDLDLQFATGWKMGMFAFNWHKELQAFWANQPLLCIALLNPLFFIFRWFKFTLKPPYTIASGNLLSAIWDTSHWTSFVKFGLKTAWDISYDILWPILKYVNFWRLQGHSSNLSKKDAFRKSIFSRWRSNKALMRLESFRWAGP